MHDGDEGNYWQDADGEKPLHPVSQAAPGQADSPDEAEPDDDSSELLFDPISWEASEYIHHERDTVWFIGFVVVVIAFLALSVFLIKNYFFTALIVVMAATLFVYVRRPPRVVRYTLSQQGLNVGQKFHFFTEFRAFGVVQDGALFSVKLLPTARFGQELTVYFAENDGEEIVDILGTYLPMEDLQLDLVDLLLRRLRL